MSGKKMKSKAAGGSFEANKDGTPWYARIFRITTTRIISQTFFFRPRRAESRPGDQYLFWRRSTHSSGKCLG